MSRRTFEANKAILAAWQNEQELVRAGKGTRDWTPEQQRDILSSKGKAYDKNGKAFQGQHMKSVEKYPEYQGDPKNIQFLTAAEHLEAHRGNWLNPTNAYYDPFTKQFFEFDEKELIPCKIIELTNSIVEVADSADNADKTKIYDEKSPLSTDAKPVTTPPNTKTTSTSSTVHNAQKPKRSRLKGFKHIFPGIKQFFFDHREEIFGGLITLTSATIAKALSSSSNTSAKESVSCSEEDLASSSSDSINASNSSESAPRCEHEVPGHSQRYHTKNGVVIREKAPYLRGGKKED